MTRLSSRESFWVPNQVRGHIQASLSSFLRIRIYCCIYHQFGLEWLFTTTFLLGPLYHVTTSPQLIGASFGSSSRNNYRICLTYQNQSKKRYTRLSVVYFRSYINRIWTSSPQQLTCVWRDLSERFWGIFWREKGEVFWYSLGQLSKRS